MSVRPSLSLAAAGAGLCLLGLTACSGGSSTGASGTASAASRVSSGAAGTASAASGGLSGKTADACSLVTPAALSQAVGVQYTAITGAGSLCTVKGPGSASFDYTVAPESAANTWSEQVSTIKGDDGQAVSEPGIGDRAVWGGEEFAAEADGYIVGVIGADFPSTAQGSGFFRTGKIAKLLISKL
jgi:hypothetical protein